MKTEILLNDFATRCFRNIADKDYIAARLCYKHNLVIQFHWQALQAMEKYLKAILLYNRIPAKKIRHDLCKALKLTENLPFKLDLCKTTLDLIKHLNNFGRFRYLEKSYHIFGHKLPQLDQAVWEIRRYCKVLNFEKKLPNGEVRHMLDLELKKIEQSRNEPFHKFRIAGGEIEKIIQKKNHPSRAALIWQNLYFGEKMRNKVLSRSWFFAENAPLDLYPQEPELLEELQKYIYLPDSVIKAYKARLGNNGH